MSIFDPQGVYLRKTYDTRRGQVLQKSGTSPIGTISIDQIEQVKKILENNGYYISPTRPITPYRTEIQHLTGDVYINDELLLTQMQYVTLLGLFEEAPLQSVFEEFFLASTADQTTYFNINLQITFVNLNLSWTYDATYSGTDNNVTIDTPKLTYSTNLMTGTSEGRACDLISESDSKYLVYSGLSSSLSNFSTRNFTNPDTWSASLSTYTADGVEVYNYIRNETLPTNPNLLILRKPEYLNNRWHITEGVFAYNIFYDLVRLYTVPLEQ